MKNGLFVAVRVRPAERMLVMRSAQPRSNREYCAKWDANTLARFGQAYGRPKSRSRSMQVALHGTPCVQESLTMTGKRTIHPRSERFGDGERGAGFSTRSFAQSSSSIPPMMFASRPKKGKIFSHPLPSFP